MKSLLLLKKKKYAALMVEEKLGELITTRETKGLDLVRRDWCTLSREVGSTVLDYILSGLGREELVSQVLEYLRCVALKVANNELGIEQYIITKGLARPPHEYPDAKSQPHVQVAKAMLEQGASVAPGAVIEYVICVDPNKSSVADRAYHPKTVLKAEGLLQIDSQWYMAQQLHPPIWRLCEPIDGLDAAQIAECLGLDASKFRASSVEHSRDELQLLGTAGEMCRFAKAKPLMLKCDACCEEHAFRGLLGHGTYDASLSTVGEWIGLRTLECAGCGSPYDCVRVQNALQLALRVEVGAYYAAPLQCDEPSCTERTLGLSTHVTRDEAGMPIFPACTVPRCKGRMGKTYDDRALHTQLLFFMSLFDVCWSRTKCETKKTLRDSKVQPQSGSLGDSGLQALESFTAIVRNALRQSAFHMIDSRQLFVTSL
jgi:DNA polymerase alpha subunit A